MSAETLRKAATLMRERAEAATRSPWVAETTEHDHGVLWWVHQAPTHYTSDVAEVIATQGDAEHIASWHPAVALAVADWLDHAAESAGLNRSPYVDDHLNRAISVARAYIGMTLAHAP